MDAPLEYIQNLSFKAQVIRTQRSKSIVIKIIDGGVYIHVPLDTARSEIEYLLDKRTSWIEKNLRFHQLKPKLVQKKFINGEYFSCLGREYLLKVSSGNYQPFTLVDKNLVATLPGGDSNPHIVRRAIVQWYKHNALEILQQRTLFYAKRLEVRPYSIGIKNYKARWGCCSAQGEIIFNWKIIIAPEFVCDYIVVHELCHLKHFNHSPRFWNLVAKILPEYKTSIAWLKFNANLLNISPPLLLP